MERDESGFTLVETLIAAAIGVLLLVGLVLMVNRFVASVASLNSRLTAQTAADHVIERITSDAQSAWAVYVPVADAIGNSNADGHEVDFFSQDGSHRPFTWGYRYDAQAKHVSRYLLSGAGPTVDEDLGAFDAFSATMVSAASLGASDALFAQSTIRSVTAGFDASQSAVGGNGFVRIDLAASGANRSELLASGSAPTTFTVVVRYTSSPAPIVTPSPPPITLTQ